MSEEEVFGFFDRTDLPVQRTQEGETVTRKVEARCVGSDIGCETLTIITSGGRLEKVRWNLPID